MFEQLEDHLLDDLGIEDGTLRGARERAEVLRRIYLAGCGGFL